MSRSFYREMIQKILELDRLTADPGEVEAWMRLEHGTLDSLGLGAFEHEVRTGARMCRDYPKESTELARSYGL